MWLNAAARIARLLGCVSRSWLHQVNSERTLIAPDVLGTLDALHSLHLGEHLSKIHGVPKAERDARPVLSAGGDHEQSARDGEADDAPGPRLVRGHDVGQSIGSGEQTRHVESLGPGEQRGPHARLERALEFRPLRTVRAHLDVRRSGRCSYSA